MTERVIEELTSPLFQVVAGRLLDTRTRLITRPRQELSRSGLMNVVPGPLP
jgi:hypothetical protein